MGKPTGILFTLLLFLMLWNLKQFPTSIWFVVSPSCQHWHTIIKNIHYNSGHMLTFTQWQQHLEAVAILTYSNHKHLQQHLQIEAVVFMCHDSNNYPTAVTVTLINNSGSVYTQWHKHLLMAAATFTSSSGNRFLISKSCR